MKGDASDESSTAAARGSTAPRERRERWWDRAGISPRTERVLDAAGIALIVVFAAGWTVSIASARPLVGSAGGDAASGATRAGAAITSALTNRDAPTAAYLTSAALDLITSRMFASDRGISGKLLVHLDTVPRPVQPDTLPPGASIGYTAAQPAGTGAPVSSPTGIGLWHLVLIVGNAIRPIADFSVITEVPFGAKRNGRIGLYYLGNWPAEKGGKLKTPAYANPGGFIQVTQQNEDTYVSEHFQLRDFLTHDQPNVWPKYIALSPKLLDKLELVLTDLQQHGVDVSGVKVMSGFRTPQYNVSGGDPTGRAALSRHMYGDAADIYIDSNHDGVMDDLNHDGRINIDDSRVILAAVDRVEAAHPELVGGAGVYVAAPGHGPFIHIDTRGYRARWVGTTGG
jgi:hypothetical protein